MLGAIFLLAGLAALMVALVSTAQQTTKSTSELLLNRLNIMPVRNSFIWISPPAIESA